MSVAHEPAIEAAGLPAINGTVVIDWELSSFFGWGVYGLNLMLNWSRDPAEVLMTGVPIDDTQIDLNPIEWGLVHHRVERSDALAAELKPFHGQSVALNHPVLHALGNDFTVAMAGRVRLCGKPGIGVTFFELTDFSTERRERAKAFPLIVAGSTWNRSLLERAGTGPTALVLQGIDPTAFHPAPKAGWFDGRFAIFSGGKLEYRKGQDLVLKAFRAFSGRHPEALLITAWASPWPSVAAGLNAANPTLEPVALQPDGKLDVIGWATANGIAPGTIIDLGAVPNSEMPRLYREMDVGLFPNRCEGGTNLVAMELMACGIPAILSRNTGHLDLIAPDRCYPLEKQAPIAGSDHEEWGESDIEEIVETLEAVWRDKEGSLARGRRGAEFMRALTWRDTVRELKKVIKPYC